MGFSTGGNTLPVFLILSNFYMNWVTALDIITVSRLMKDPETVTSNDGAFKLGFFSPGKMSNRYVGIWYLRIQCHMGGQQRPTTRGFFRGCQLSPYPTTETL